VLVGHARHAVERMLRRLETLGYFDVQDGR